MRRKTPREERSMSAIVNLAFNKVMKCAFFCMPAIHPIFAKCTFACTSACALSCRETRKLHNRRVVGKTCKYCTYVHSFRVSSCAHGRLACLSSLLRALRKWFPHKIDRRSHSRACRACDKRLFFSTPICPYLRPLSRVAPKAFDVPRP